jgi:cobalt-zinc-cadmium efflux system membrane fusion protein
MRRFITRIVVVLVLALAITAGIVWSRPDLLAALQGLARTPGGVPANQRAPAHAEEAQPKPAPERVDDGWCERHGKPESRCEECREDATLAATCQASLPVIRLDTPAIAARVGLETALVESRRHARAISGNAEILYNDHFYADVIPRVAGIVREVHAEHGQRVKPGDVLVVVDSAEVGSAKAQYLAALPVVKLAEATLKRTQELTRSNALPLKDELEAATALNRARADLLNAAQRLRNLGFTESELVDIERNRDTTSLLRVVAPIEGTVVERHAVIGEAVEARHALVTVADLREMWAAIDVYESDIVGVQPGQPVTVTITGLEPRVFTGDVHFIETSVNRETRTIRVVAEVHNQDDLLRANQFGRGSIVVGQPHDAVLVPTSAIQSFQGADLVFLVQPDGSYRPQRIELGTEPDFVPGMREVEWGLSPGQRVVTTGAFLLKSELVEDAEGPSSGHQH